MYAKQKNAKYWSVVFKNRSGGELVIEGKKGLWDGIYEFILEYTGDVDHCDNFGIVTNTPVGLKSYNI